MSEAVLSPDLCKEVRTRILTWLLAHPGWHDISELVEAGVTPDAVTGCFSMGAMAALGYVDIKGENPKFRATGKLLP